MSAPGRLESEYRSAEEREGYPPTGRTLTLVGRVYCHLCDEMAAALAPIAKAHGARVVILDADADQTLETAYGERVPVLLLGDPRTGVELCHYRLDADRVEAALTAADPPAEPETC